MGFWNIYIGVSIMGLIAVGAIAVYMDIKEYQRRVEEQEKINQKRKSIVNQWVVGIEKGNW